MKRGGIIKHNSDKIPKHPDPPPSQKLKRICTWSPDDDENWETQCGNYHTFFDGSPLENEYLFCPYCGARLVEINGKCHEE